MCLNVIPDFRRASILIAILFLGCMVTTCRAQEQREVVAKPTPVYPEIARRMNLMGIVKIKATIGPDGRVKRVDVIGGHPLLTDAAVDAVKRWKYASGKTETEVELEFHFHP
ncbi:MAG: energy transducer TonB [Acidobacteria bacterium]|nr:energy transducer TonB [Acidobacteriota bacterium]